MRSCNQEVPTQGPRVRFSEMSEMVLVSKLSESPDRDNIWFTRDELDAFRANMICCKNIVRLLISKRQMPTANEIVGLEKFLTIQLTGEYKVRREKLTKDVLDEARRQRRAACRGVPHSETVDQLARISVENSRWARERAQAAAAFLEQDQEAERLQEFV